MRPSKPVVDAFLGSITPYSHTPVEILLKLINKTIAYDHVLSGNKSRLIYKLIHSESQFDTPRHHPKQISVLPGCRT